MLLFNIFSIGIKVEAVFRMSLSNIMPIMLLERNTIAMLTPANKITGERI